MEKDLNNDINQINKYADLISHVINEQALLDMLDEIRSKIPRLSIGDIHPLIINSLCNNICAKILTFSLKKEISQKCAEFINFMAQNLILPPVYRDIFSGMLTKDSSSHMLNEMADRRKKRPRGRRPQKNSLNDGDSDLQDSELAEETNTLTENVNNHLNVLLNIDLKAERYVNKNFGYALLDLNGDFIWCDSNSEKFFEMRSKELASENFFNLMIPFSRNFLTKKFGEELFTQTNSIGSSLSFSYVIYSKNSMNKFLKCLKKLGITNEMEFKDRLKKKDAEDSIYHQYLKSLSSRATLILLKFTKAEFKDMISCPKYNINVTSSLAGIVSKDQSKAREDPEAEPEDHSQISEKVQEAKHSTEKAQEDIQESLNKLEKINSMNKDDASEVVFRNAVLLETRLSLNVPQFDYRKLSDDPIIKQFEEKILSKISK